MTSVDPRLKYELSQSLIASVYGGLKERHHEAIEGIAKRNTVLNPINAVIQCFTYKGQIYNYTHFKTGVIPWAIRRAGLHSSLHAEMDAILKEKQIVADTERPYVLSLITRAMNKTNSIEDYKLMLPDCLHDELNMYPNWVTTRELTDEQVQEFIQNNEKALNFLRIRKVLDLILT